MEVLGTRPSDKKEASENFLTAFKLSKFLDCRSVLSGVLSTAADYAGELNMLWVHEGRNGCQRGLPCMTYAQKEEEGGSKISQICGQNVTKSQKL